MSEKSVVKMRSPTEKNSRLVIYIDFANCGALEGGPNAAEPEGTSMPLHDKMGKLRCDFRPKVNWRCLSTEPVDQTSAAISRSMVAASRMGLYGLEKTAAS